MAASNYKYFIFKSHGSSHPGAGSMESYGEWRVTVYEIIFGELKFFDSHTT